ncbi:MAG: hypothetical protein ABJZ55_05745 [Fuerstiella sp.]
MHQQSQPRFSSRRILIAGVGLVTAVLLVAILLASPDEECDAIDLLPQLGPGQIVEDCGKFRFPRGNRTLHLSEDDHSNVHIAVHVRSSVVCCVPFTTIPYRTVPWESVEHEVVVESEREWFASVDRYDRLWVYYGRWDKQWGNLRKLPGGGTRPYAPAIIMHGLSFLRSGGLTVHGQVVSDTGDWGGVPADFLKRVQEATELETDEKCVIPATPPTFTSQQDFEITQRLKHAS